MRHIKYLKLILLFSFSLSLLGFILDLNERVPDIWVNLLDVFLMTTLIFVVFVTIYFVAFFAKRLIYPKL